MKGNPIWRPWARLQEDGLHLYIHTFPGSLWTTTISNSSISDHLSSRFSASRTNAPRLLSQPKAGTRSPSLIESHTAAHTVKQGCFGRGWYHYPRCALCAVEMLGGRLSKRLICRFLVFPIYICERPSRALPISASIQIA